MRGTASESFSDYAAPPGHVTFSVLDQAHGGHSVSISAREYPGVVRATKTVLSNLSRATAFKGAIEIIRHRVGCADGCWQCENDGLLNAFISALLNHPDKRSRKTLMASISTSLKKEGGAHVILFMPPTGPSAWLLGTTSNNGDVQ